MQPNLYLNMPVGEYYGWAICGKYLLQELLKKADVGYVADGFEGAFRDDDLDSYVKGKTVTVERDIDKPFIYATTCQLKRFCKFRGSKNIGYMFYERDHILPEHIENAKQNFDVMVGGSKWNGELLGEAGLPCTSIPQGVDRSIFKPNGYRKDDRFVVFSGGKFERRKGQDIVLKAVAQIQKRHRNVYLVVSWHNIFEAQKYIEGMYDGIKESKIKNFLPMELMPQPQLAATMSQTHIGIFPNRKEGGTNLVLMEYLACGRPVIARNETGQKDVLSQDYAYLTEGNDSRVLRDTIDYLEDAYKNREKLVEMGKKADQAMNQFSWERTAREFLEIAYA